MKKDYMTRLERAARWRLPRQEAEEVIADYRDIVGTPPRPEEELIREVGRPEQVVRLLVSPSRAYRIWQAMFAAMAVCILLPALAPLPAGPFVLIHHYASGSPLPLALMILGVGLSIVCFRRRKGEAKATLPWAIPLVLLVLLIVLIADGWLIYQISIFPNGLYDGRPISYGLRCPPPEDLNSAVYHITTVLEWVGCGAAGILGVAALVLARTRDRRWAAVYALSFTVVALSLCILAAEIFLYPFDYGMDWWQLWCWWQYPALAAVGLIGTGAALW